MSLKEKTREQSEVEGARVLLYHDIDEKPKINWGSVPCER